jgi:DNA polymerase-3 subunit epsilon
LIDFIALDVETANPDLASICQIGIIAYANGQVVHEWQSFIDPEDYFDPSNINIHGIDEEKVIGAPIFPKIEEDLRRLLYGQIVTTHTAFDKASINRSLIRYGLPIIECTWLDTARVARRAWVQFAQKGYGIANLAQYLDIKFTQHIAIEDARATGEVLLHAIADTGLSISDWLRRIEQPIFPSSPSSLISIARQGNPNGSLAGEVIVFTGALNITRHQAAEMAAQAGCDVGAGVTKDTTLLVVGDQDIRKLAGHDKSSKHRKAETLIKSGQVIRILKESDFLRLITEE